MITTTVLIVCDHTDGDDYCEATFEMSRDSVPDAMRALAQNQLRLRGWVGTIPGRVTCPLHVAEGKRRAVDQAETDHA